MVVEEPLVMALIDRLHRIMNAPDVSGVGSEKLVLCMPAGMASDPTRGLQCLYVLQLDTFHYSSITRAAALPC